jgi:acetyl esterase/lipase
MMPRPNHRLVSGLAVLVLLALSLVACSSDETTSGGAATSAPSTIAGASVLPQTLVYGSAAVRSPASASVPLHVDVYVPPDPPAGPLPVVVLIHGGGFTSRSRTDAGIVRIARALAVQGVVAASIDYRLLGREPDPSERVAPLVAALPKAPLFTGMASAVDDTLTAIDYLRDHAGDLGLDMDRLGLIGSSAGAITADHVAYALDDHGIDGPKVRFVASLWGGMFVPPPAGQGELAADQLEHGEAALFAVHGDADPRVPVKLDDQLIARAKAEDVPSEYHRIPGGGHGYGDSRFFTYEASGGRTPYERLLAFVADEL